MDINKINKVLGGIAIFLIISLFLQKVIIDIIAYNRFDWKRGVVTSENYPFDQVNRGCLMSLLAQYLKIPQKINKKANFTLKEISLFLP